MATVVLQFYPELNPGGDYAVCKLSSHEEPVQETQVGQGKVWGSEYRLVCFRVQALG